MGERTGDAPDERAAHDDQPPPRPVEPPREQRHHGEQRHYGHKPVNEQQPCVQQPQTGEPPPGEDDVLDPHAARRAAAEQAQRAKRADLMERLRIMNRWSRYGPK